MTIKFASFALMLLVGVALALGEEPLELMKRQIETLFGDEAVHIEGLHARAFAIVLKDFENLGYPLENYRVSIRVDEDFATVIFLPVIDIDPLKIGAQSYGTSVEYEIALEDWSIQRRSLGR